MPTPKALLDTLSASQNNKHITVNENAYRLEFYTHRRVLDRDLAAPPATPAAGDAYIVAPGASGAWSGQDGRLALFRPDGAWDFIAPVERLRLWLADESQWLVYDGTAWVPDGGGLYDLGVYLPGAPAAGEQVMQFVSARAVELPAGLAGSRAYAATAPGAAASLPIKKNGVAIGSIDFAAASNTATFTVTAGVSLLAGDRLTIEAPSPADASLADLSITLAGRRP